MYNNGIMKWTINIHGSLCDIQEMFWVLFCLGFFSENLLTWPNCNSLKMIFAMEINKYQKHNVLKFQMSVTVIEC